MIERGERRGEKKFDSEEINERELPLSTIIDSISPRHVESLFFSQSFGDAVKEKRLREEAQQRQRALELAVTERQAALRRVQGEIVERKEASHRLRQRIEEDKVARQHEAVQVAHAARQTLERTMEERREEHQRIVQERQETHAREMVCVFFY